MTTVEILRQAKAELLRCGWCQHTARSAAGERCAVAACGEWFQTVRDVFMRANKIQRDDQSVAGWNDEPGRTPEEVLAAFDAAIALAEQEATDAELLAEVAW